MLSTDEEGNGIGVGQKHPTTRGALGKASDTQKNWTWFEDTQTRFSSNAQKTDRPQRYSLIYVSSLVQL